MILKPFLQVSLSMFRYFNCWINKNFVWCWNRYSVSEFHIFPINFSIVYSSNLHHMYPSIYLYIYLSIYLFIYQSTCLSVYLYIYGLIVTHALGHMMCDLYGATGGLVYPAGHIVCLLTTYTYILLYIYIYIHNIYIYIYIVHVIYSIYGYIYMYVCIYMHI